MIPERKSIFTETPDADTMGSRILRAREAAGMALDQVAENLAVIPAEIEAWESDRSEPAARNLTRLAGMLGVSPTWLIDGIGAAPSAESAADELSILRQQLAAVKDQRDSLTNAIDNMERALERLSAKIAE